MTKPDDLDAKRKELEEQIIDFYTKKRITKKTKDSALAQLKNMDKINPDYYISCHRKVLYFTEGSPSLYTAEAKALRVQESLKKQKESSIFYIAANLEEQHD